MAVKLICLVAAFIISLGIWLKVFKNNPNLREHHAEEHKAETPAESNTPPQEKAE